MIGQITQAAFDAVKNNPNSKIRAIKQFKESTGWGLIESKTVIDLVTELVNSQNKNSLEPDWSKVPEGYNWVAVEERGEVFCYKEEPYWNDYNDHWDTEKDYRGLLACEVFNLNPLTLIWKRPGQFFEGWTEQDYFDHCGKFYVNQYEQVCMLAQTGNDQFRLISKKGNRYADDSCFGNGFWREVASW